MLWQDTQPRRWKSPVDIGELKIVKRISIQIKFRIVSDTLNRNGSKIAIQLLHSFTWDASIAACCNTHRAKSSTNKCLIYETDCAIIGLLSVLANLLPLSKCAAC